VCSITSEGAAVFTRFFHPDVEGRAQKRAAAEQVADLKWRWRCACEGTPLANFVYTPSGVTKAVPQITGIELGPPVALTVRVRLGQSAADFITAAPSIALALGVAAVEVVEMNPSWLLRIVLRSEPLAAVGQYRTAG
jgi:hypothetical protein